MMILEVFGIKILYLIVLLRIFFFSEDKNHTEASPTGLILTFGLKLQLISDNFRPVF